MSLSYTIIVWTIIIYIRSLNICDITVRMIIVLRNKKPINEIVYMKQIFFLIISDNSFLVKSITMRNFIC